MSSLSLINKARHLQVFLSYNVYECNFKKKPYPHTFRVEKSITSTGEGVNHCDDGVEGTFFLMSSHCFIEQVLSDLCQCTCWYFSD